ncbi:unnamed protein product [Gadus morhua 'NCC']
MPGLAAGGPPHHRAQSRRQVLPLTFVERVASLCLQDPGGEWEGGAWEELASNTPDPLIWHTPRSISLAPPPGGPSCHGRAVPRALRRSDTTAQREGLSTRTCLEHITGDTTRLTPVSRQNKKPLAAKDKMSKEGGEGLRERLREGEIDGVSGKGSGSERKGLGAKGGCDSNENLVGRSVRPQVGHQWWSGTMVVFSPFPQLSDSGLDAELRRGSPGVAIPHCSGN